jgi:hypothetical protein
MVVFLVDKSGFLHHLVSNTNAINRVATTNVLFRKIIHNDGNVYLLDFENNIYVGTRDNQMYNFNKINLDNKPLQHVVDFNILFFDFSERQSIILILIDKENNYYIFENNKLLKIFTNITSHFMLLQHENNKLLSKLLLVVNNEYRHIVFNVIGNKINLSTSLYNNIDDTQYYYSYAHNQNLKYLFDINIVTQILFYRPTIIKKEGELICVSSDGKNVYQYDYTIINEDNNNNVKITSMIDIVRAILKINNQIICVGTNGNKYIIDIDNFVILAYPNLFLDKYDTELLL